MDSAAMTQFYLVVYIALYFAIATMMLQTVIVCCTLWQTRKTHHLVNSELSEWKSLLKTNALQFAATERAAGVREGRDQGTERG